MTPVPSFAPRGIAAHASNPELSDELQMFGELLAVHACGSYAPSPRLRRVHRSFRDGGKANTTSVQLNQKLLDSIEHSGSDARLALKRQMFRALGADEGYLVGVDVETGIVARHVVGDHQIDVLLLALR